MRPEGLALRRRVPRVQRQGAWANRTSKGDRSKEDRRGRRSPGPLASGGAKGTGPPNLDRRGDGIGGGEPAREDSAGAEQEGLTLVPEVGGQEDQRLVAGDVEERTGRVGTLHRLAAEDLPEVLGKLCGSVEGEREPARSFAGARSTRGGSGQLTGRRGGTLSWVQEVR